MSGLVKLYYSARRSQNEDHVHDNDDDRDDDDDHDDNDDDDNDGDKRWPRPNYQASLPPIGCVLFLRGGGQVIARARINAFGMKLYVIACPMKKWITELWGDDYGLCRK